MCNILIYVIKHIMHFFANAKCCSCFFRSSPLAILHGKNCTVSSLSSHSIVVVFCFCFSCNLPATCIYLNNLKMQIKLASSPSHSILILGQPVLALTAYWQAPGRTATRVPSYWYDSIDERGVWSPNSPVLMADTLPLGPEAFPLEQFRVIRLNCAWFLLHLRSPTISVGFNLLGEMFAYVTVF